MTELTDLFADLSRFQTRASGEVDAALASLGGLTAARYEVLRVLAATAPVRVNDIADALAMTWGGTSKIVDKLEAAGLCIRRPNPSDGRSSLIELTSSGQRQAVRADRVVDGVLRDLLGQALSPTAVDQLRRAAARLRTSQPGRRVTSSTA